MQEGNNSPRVFLSHAAEEDMYEILAWTCQHFGEIQEERYQELIWLAMDELEADPLPQRSHERADLNPSARVLHLSRLGRAASHYFVYRLVDNVDVEIIRILHDKQDLPRQLGDDFDR